jgi:hypothetical protein
LLPSLLVNGLSSSAPCSHGSTICEKVASQAAGPLFRLLLWLFLLRTPLIPHPLLPLLLLLMLPLPVSRSMTHRSRIVMQHDPPRLHHQAGQEIYMHSQLPECAPTPTFQHLSTICCRSQPSPASSTPLPPLHCFPHSPPHSTPCTGVEWGACLRVASRRPWCLSPRTCVGTPRLSFHAANRATWSGRPREERRRDHGQEGSPSANSGVSGTPVQTPPNTHRCPQR